MKKILNGLIAFIIVAGILLLSDLGNRKNSDTKRNDTHKKVYKICFVHYTEAAISEEAERGVHDEFANQGLVEGKDFTMKVMSAQGDMATLNSIAEAVSSETWDLIFTASTPTLQVFCKKITNSPIIFTNAGDPIGAGVGESFEKHLPNLTGISTLSDFPGMIDLIQKTIPGIKTIGTIYVPGEINSVKYAEELKKAATEKGLITVTVPANSATEVSDAALAITNQGIEAMAQIADNLTASCSEAIIKQTNAKDIPFFGFISSQLEKGAVATLARDYHQAGVDAVRLGMEILNKKSPADLPIRHVSKTITQFNADAMKRFNLKMPEGYDKQSKPFDHPVKIAMVHYVSSPDCDDVTKGILTRFEELGHKKGTDFTFEEYNANADMATLNTIVRTVAEKKFDLIFSTVLASTQALAEKIDNVPILFTVVADPVGNGLGKSYEEHRANLAGIDGMSYTDKGIELLLKYQPAAKNIGVLFCPGEMASISGLNELKKSCKKYGLNLISAPVNSVSEVTDATTLLCSKKIDAISQLPDNCTIPGFASMVKVTQKEGKPLYAYITSQVEMGAIAAIAGDYVEQGREIADIGLEVLGGKSPADIPYTRIRQIKTVINPDAAKRYGLQTPDELFKKADIVVKN